jgi:hypothetical protein
MLRGQCGSQNRLRGQARKIRSFDGAIAHIFIGHRSEARSRRGGGKSSVQFPKSYNSISAAYAVTRQTA